MHFKKLCVLGLGYIGLPMASTFATHGLDVTGVDVNPQVLATLRNGGIHIQEPGLRTLVEAALKSNNLKVSDKPEGADAFIIAVPTPFFNDKYGDHQGQKYRLADMRAVVSAAKSIVPFLRKGNLVVLESTSPPRTTVDRIAPILEETGLKAGDDFYLAYSPERVLPGQILRELIENARVIGGITDASAQAGRDLYSLFVKGEIVLTDATTAEMVKLAENTYRDVNIAIANEFSRLADQFGVNVWEVICIANLHPRVKILSPGPGVGGHCVKVDPWFLVEAAPELSQLIRTARQVNDAQPDFVVDLVRRALAVTFPGSGQDMKGKQISVLGLAFKPDVDDLRESPAIEIAHLLYRHGAKVTAFEPFKPNANVPGVTMVATLEAALENTQMILLLVGHKQFRELSATRIADLTSTRMVVDTVNAINETEWQAAGFTVFKLGVGSQSNPICSTRP